MVYRVAKESLHNVLKHSQASSVKVLLDLADKKIRLSVHDDGVGFSPETAKGESLSFGLAGMQERATLLGGTLAPAERTWKGCHGDSGIAARFRKGCQVMSKIRILLNR